MKNPASISAESFSRSVLGAAAGVLIWLIFLMALFPESMQVSFLGLQYLVIRRFGWFYIVSVTLLLVFCGWLFFGVHGRTRLGGPQARPEFGTWPWWLMIFIVGTGNGLVFHGAAEPAQHFTHPLAASPGSVRAAIDALLYTFFHWGLHGWSVFAVTALAIAIFGYQSGRPLTVRSALRPLLRASVDEPFGGLIDILAIISSVIGAATMFGFAAVQFGELMAQTGFAQGVAIARPIIVLIMAALAVLLAGIDPRRGLQRCAMAFSACFLVIWLVIVCTGPTQFLLDALPENLGTYLQRLPMLSLRTNAYQQNDWMVNWTMYYWAWWIAWTPFAGLFIARISYGRTIRELVMGTVIVPTLLCCAWFGVIGDTAIWFDLHQGAGISSAVDAHPTLALHLLLGHLPWRPITQWLGAAASIGTPLATASVAILSAGMLCGVRQPGWWILSTWGVLSCIMALLLVEFGDLHILNAIAIMAGLPFCVLMLAMCLGFIRHICQPGTTSFADTEPSAEDTVQTRQVE